jgi:hypothetical protein
VFEEHGFLFILMGYKYSDVWCSFVHDGCVGLMSSAGILIKKNYKNTVKISPAIGTDAATLCVLCVLCGEKRLCVVVAWDSARRWDYVIIEV